MAGFLLGVTSVVLRENKLLGLTGITFVLVGAELKSGVFLGVDWFLLNLIAYCALFLPLERLFARLPNQPVFHHG